MWNQQFRCNENGDLPAMFEEAPVTRSFNSLDAPVTRAFGGVSALEANLSIPSFARENDNSFWGVHEEGPASVMQAANKLGGLNFDSLNKGSNVSKLSLREEVVQTLEPVPFYVEKYSCFVSTSEPSDMLAALAAVFDATNVDHESVVQKHKMKGLAYDAQRAGQCSFRVQLYRAEQKEHIVVEFQRRSGCVVTFHAFFSRCLSILGKEHVLALYGEPETAFDSDSRPAREPAVDLNLALDPATGQALFAMGMSNNADVQREALKVLAACASTSENQIFLAEGSPDTAQLMELLELTLNSRDDEVRRCAALFLTSVCKQESIRSVVAETLALVLLDQLDTPARLDNRETKRHLASALAWISDTHASQLPLKDLSALKRYAQCADFELRDSVNRTLRNLGESC